MTAIARKIPALRFPEFEGGWEEKKLGKDINLISGQHLSPGEYNNDEDGVPYFTGPSDFTNDAICLTKWTQKSTKTAMINDVLLTVKGSGVGSIMFLKLPEVAMGRQLMAVRAKGAIAPFLYQILSMKAQLFEKLAAGNMIPGITREDILQTKVHLPTLPEQQKIAAFLSTIDTRIQQLSRKKALLEQYKKGVMQQIFSQEIRFKDEDGKEFPAWEEKRLGEIGTTFGGLSGKTKENFGKGKPYITYKQIFDNSEINTSKFDFVEIGQGEKQSRVQYGDVFFTTSSETPNEVGFASVLLEPVDELYLNSFCFGYRPNSFNLLKPDFARFLFRSQQFREMVVKLAQGSTRYNMSKTQLMKLKVSLPAEPEQQKIATFLSTIDRQINLASQQLNRMQTFKKGLLQQLFV